VEQDKGAGGSLGSPVGFALLWCFKQIRVFAGRAPRERMASMTSHLESGKLMRKLLASVVSGMAPALAQGRASEDDPQDGCPTSLPCRSRPTACTVICRSRSSVRPSRIHAAELSLHQDLHVISTSTHVREKVGSRLRRGRCWPQARMGRRWPDSTEKPSITANADLCGSTLCGRAQTRWARPVQMSRLRSLDRCQSAASGTEAVL